MKIRIISLERKTEIRRCNGVTPDPSWKWTSKLGRVYRWKGDKVSPKPRIEIEHIPCHDDECGCEGYDVKHYFDPKTKEEFVPGTMMTDMKLPGRSETTGTCDITHTSQSELLKLMSPTGKGTRQRPPKPISMDDPRVDWGKVKVKDRPKGKFWITKAFFYDVLTDRVCFGGKGSKARCDIWVQLDK